MKAFEKMNEMGHENLVYCYEKESGLKSIIAIHDTTLGPALGGTRFYNYANEDEALYDVLRLSKAMTLKNAACGLQAGGGKAVIIGNPEKIKTAELLKAYGRMINNLNGTYYTAEDMNISDTDIEIINSETTYCVGRKEIGGDPSPFTALGCYEGIKACVKEVFGSDNLEGKKISISGLGAVGYRLAEMLHEAGVLLTVADVKVEVTRKAEKDFGAKVVGINDIYSLECDVFAPCARGATVSKENAEKYKCKIIAGAANNVLVNDEAGDKLHKLGILYAPDYIINAGGIISCGNEINPEGYNKDEVITRVKKIYDRLAMIIKIAREKDIPTYKAADEYALGIIEAAKKKEVY